MMKQRRVCSPCKRKFSPRKAYPFKAEAEKLIEVERCVMPRLDVIHDAVKNALIKDGWVITDDPFIIEYDRAKFFADLAAEKPFAAERNGEKIVVEIKSFIGASKLQDLKGALGQYDIYLYLLGEVEPNRKLYVAISEKAYANFFNQSYVQLIVRKHKLPLIVVDLNKEEIVKWIS